MSGENSEILTKSDETLRLGEFTLSLQTDELTNKNGETVHLRSQSTDVLVHLAQQSGQLVSKSDLIAKVWPDTFVTDDSLGQCIADIRRALNDSGHKIVRTFPKKGYMLSAEAISGGLAAQSASNASALPQNIGEVVAPRKPVPLHIPLTGIAVLLLLISAAIWWQPLKTAPVAPQDLAFDLRAEPSIIVLPFENQSGDDELSYLAEGFSTTIRTLVSKFPQVFVIAGSTSATFKDNPGTARGIGRELGVRYVLDGSLWRQSDAFVINTELIEAATERSIWAQQYEFYPENIFSIQADLVEEITSTLHVVIGEEEVATALQQPTDNPDAYDLLLRAEATVNLLSNTGRKEAILLLNEAVALDPDYLAAHFELSGRYLGLWRFGGSDDPEETLRLARHHAERALELDQTDYRGHFRIGMLHLFADHDHEPAYSSFLRALDDNPNDADVNYHMGFLRSLMGDAAEAIEWNNRAKRINPRYPGWYNFNAAMSHFFVKDYLQALTLARSGIAAYPRSLAPRRILIATLAEMGRLDEAKAEVGDYLEIRPDFRLSTFRNTPFQHREDEERYFDAMRTAGIPD